MAHHREFLFFWLFLISYLNCNTFGQKEIVDVSPPFDDSIYYKIKWIEKKETSEDDNHIIPKSTEVTESENGLWVKTNNKETYFCQIPSIASTTDGKSEGSEGSSPFLEMSPYKLLKPLMNREVCSYRLEQYWTYELCHGRFIRQFHEESTIQKLKGQEFFLGKYDITHVGISEQNFQEKLALLKKAGLKAPTVNIEGVNLPYVEFNFTGGTLCDLNKKARSTRVLYVCSENSKHELHSVKEIYTCEYEAIVLSPMLCLHRDYLVTVANEHDINCHPVGDSPPKPVDITSFEAGMRAESKPESLFDGKTIIIDAADLTSSGAIKLELKIHDSDGNELSSETFNEMMQKVASGPSVSSKHSQPPATDSSILQDFLSGRLCLQGGTGWWKYEFCYGNHVEQYHEDGGERKDSIILGKWNLEEHKAWLQRHPEKRPKVGKTPKQVSHFYGSGDLCDLTKKHRHVEVKLKCKYQEGHKDSVALYLLEPKTCEYVLGIESPIICNLLSSIDVNGLMNIEDEGFDDVNPSDADRSREEEESTASSSTPGGSASEIKINLRRIQQEL